MTSGSDEEVAMVRHFGHSGGHGFARANRAVLLSLMWVALFGCVAAASIYDVGRWFDAW
jgi:hypothetical protein